MLSLLDVYKLSVSENIVIALLGLLAADSLIERLNVLERLDARIGKLATGQLLRSRRDMLSVREQTEHASEICIAAVSAISVSIQNAKFFETKVRKGCRVRVILLNPVNPVLEVWNMQNRFTSAETDIKSTLQTFSSLQQIKSKGKFEVRLSDVFLPFSMVATDMQRQTGTMIVEFHGFKVALDERPHILLTAQDNPDWFKHYKLQFEEAWSKAKPWSPQ